MQDRKGEGPLSSEELARDEWREGGAKLKPEDAPGHTLPESERDRTSHESGGTGAGGAPRTILPPD